LSSKHVVVATKDEKTFNTSQHVEFVVLVGLLITITSGKITKEQLIETTFLSNLGYHHVGKETTLRCAGSHDILQQPHGGSAIVVSINGMMNVFHSKSIGKHTTRLAIQKLGVGLANAYSDFVQDVSTSCCQELDHQNTINSCPFKSILVCKYVKLCTFFILIP
jgi:hypothetical protein